MRTFALPLFLLAVLPVPAHATSVIVFDNPAYVDTGSSGASSDDLQALLGSLGYSVSTFTGITASDIAAAGNSANLILFPGLLNFGALASDLSPAADAALASYVAAGGGLIVTGGSGERLLNVALYPACDFTTVFCFASTGTSGPSFLDSTVAAGTSFSSAPATLTVPPQPDGAINPFAFTPAGGLNLYRDEVAGFFNGTTVLTAPYGAGHYGFLGWTYADSLPLGSQDGGWDSVLNTMVQSLASTNTPEPGTTVLFGSALLAFGAWRSRARA